MWRRQKKAKETEEIKDVAPSILLEAIDGSFQVVFSNKVVNSVRQLLARIESRTDLVPKLGMISALRGEGVTYISQALGTIMANDLGVEICIVDLNWWHSSYKAEVGLSDLVYNRKMIDDVLVSTNLPNLFVIPSGELTAEQRPIVARSEALYQALEDLEERFDFLIMDIPAILSTSEAVPLATMADANCLVIHQGATASSSVRLALDEVRHLNLLGIVMNQVETYTPSTLLNILPIE